MQPTNDQTPEQAPEQPSPQPDDVLQPGETKLELRPGDGSIEVLYSGWLACDGQFVVKSTRAKNAITVHVEDRNSSTERMACVGPTYLRTVVEGLAPGTYEVAFHPGRGYAVLRHTTRVER